MFKVLWIDDKFKELEDLADRADDYGLELVGFESHEELVDEINSPRFDEYKAVVLDGIYKENKNDIEPDSVKAFIQSIKFLDSEKAKGKRIDVVCLSGNSDFKELRKEDLQVYEIPIFNKRNLKRHGSENEETVWEYLKEICENKPENDIREKYKEPLKLFEKEYLGNKNKERIIEILKDIEGPNFSEFRVFGEMRKFVETIIETLTSKGVLPEISLNDTKKLFQNNHEKYILEAEADKLLPSTLKYVYCSLIDILQDGSHRNGKLKLKVDDYVNENKRNNYIAKICAFQLLEFMNGSIRLMKEIKIYPEVNFFKPKKIYKQEIIVTLGSPKNGNPGVLLSNDYGIPTHNNDLKAGDKIKITESTKATGWLKIDYMCKYYIKEFKKVKNTDL